MDEAQAQRIRGLLKQRAHAQIDAYTSGWRTVEISCPAGLTLREYVDILEKEPGELQRLVRRLFVSTTSFFRDPEHWEELLNTLTCHRREATPIEALSVGCARGQEPYSLLMGALERGGPPIATVIATDVNKTNLETARKGLYKLNELGEVPESCRERWFTRTTAGWQIAETLRNGVEFVHYDILTDPPADWKDRFDLVMMRNVLIHMKPEYQQIAVVNAVSMVTRGGILFLGASEVLPEPEQYGIHRIGHCLFSRG